MRIDVVDHLSPRPPSLEDFRLALLGRTKRV
jgi:hypothetical protein